jgi:hypothetical protein
MTSERERERGMADHYNLTTDVSATHLHGGLDTIPYKQQVSKGETVLRFVCMKRGEMYPSGRRDIRWGKIPESGQRAGGPES